MTDEEKLKLWTAVDGTVREMCHPPRHPPKRIVGDNFVLYVSVDDGRVYAPCTKCGGAICMRYELPRVQSKL